MNMCSDGHEEIVHEERRCPLCSKISDLESAEKTISDLQETINDL